MSLTLALGGREVVLLPQRAAFVPDIAWLLVADAHLGKAHAFRRLGVPVPEATTDDNLQRLGDLIDRHGARGVAFLGDLLHARHGRGEATLQAVARWRARRADVRMVLVRGNHDSRAGDPPADWDVEAVDEPWPLPGPGSLRLCHHPQAVSGAHVLAGHVHPAARVGRGADSLRLPCFHVGPDTTVLPAFGGFTGMHVVTPAAGDHLFVVAGEVVREVRG